MKFTIMAAGTTQGTSWDWAFLSEAVQVQLQVGKSENPPSNANRMTTKQVSGYEFGMIGNQIVFTNNL